VRELVLIAQDLASWGHDRRRAGRGEPVEVLDEGGTQPLIELTRTLSREVDRVRLLYLYPSGLTSGLIDAILESGVPYFDLSLQHASRPLLRAMRRWGDADRFLERIAAIRASEPDATFRSSFILGYPGETEDDQRRLIESSTRRSSTGPVLYVLFRRGHARRHSGRASSPRTGARAAS